MTGTVKKPNKKTFTFKLSEDLLQNLKEYSATHDLTMTQVLKNAVSDLLKAEK